MRVGCSDAGKEGRREGRKEGVGGRGGGTEGRRDSGTEGVEGGRPGGTSGVEKGTPQTRPTRARYSHTIIIVTKGLYLCRVMP
jgi:hypothetical protein